MSENKLSILPDVVTPISDAVQQNIPETVSQTDGVLSTVVGFFNNVVLYPVKKANLTFHYKLEAFEDDLKDKIKNIPVENLHMPPTMIVGPTLEALRYAYDEEELRDMYENLLASSMDSRRALDAHPAFVDAIKQMSPLDALILNTLVDLVQVRCASIKFQVRNATSVYTNAMPDFFVEELSDLSDPFAISSSLVNLERLAFIKITGLGIIGEDYTCMKEHPYVKSRAELFKNLGIDIDIKISEHAIIITDFGKQFSKICLEKKI